MVILFKKDTVRTVILSIRKIIKINVILSAIIFRGLTRYIKNSSRKAEIVFIIIVIEEKRLIVFDKVIIRAAASDKIIFFAVFCLKSFSRNVPFNSVNMKNSTKQAVYSIIQKIYVKISRPIPVLLPVLLPLTFFGLQEVFPRSSKSGHH